MYSLIDLKITDFEKPDRSQKTSLAHVYERLAGSVAVVSQGLKIYDFYCSSQTKARETVKTSSQGIEFLVSFKNNRQRNMNC